jgi:2-desacetyl-2-hydroxyethyl bacteriochlorophyllide A dehydrogenase
MRAVRLTGPEEIRVEERPEPAAEAPDDAVVRVEVAGICGSDLHFYSGRLVIDEGGFTIGHEFVGEVVDTGPAVASVAAGDRVVGCFCTACGQCFFCRRRLFHKCVDSKMFGGGAVNGGLEGAQAEYVRVPHADVVLRKVPEGLRSDVALFAGDVMGTGYHAVADVRPGDVVAVLGLGPVGLCAVQAARAAGASAVIGVDAVPERLKMARAFGAEPVHLHDGDPRGAAKSATDGRGVDVAVDAVGHPSALESAIRLVRGAGTVSATGVYTERLDLHMGLLWAKGATLRTGWANVIGHVDRVLGLLADGTLDPSPLITRHMSLEEAPEAYASYARREALKIVLEP